MVRSERRPSRATERTYMTEQDAIPHTSLVSAHHAAWLAWTLWAFTLLLVIAYLPLRLYWYARAIGPEGVLPTAAVAPSLNTTPRLIADLFGAAGVLAFATLGALIVTRAR